MKNKLSEINIGDIKKIKDIKDSDFSIKLQEMGIVKGTWVCLERKAPLGDPYIISARGYKLGLRKKEADTILLE